MTVRLFLLAHYITVVNAERVQKLIIVRHGESTYTKTHSGVLHVATSLHNGEDYTDAPLSDNGHAQGRLLNQIFKQDHILENHIPQSLHEKIELVVTSPLTRALMTTSLIMKERKFKPIPMIAHPAIREVPSSAQDIGRDVKTLRKEFRWINFDLVPDGVWWRKPTDTQHHLNSKKQLSTEQDFVSDQFDVSGVGYRNIEFRKWLASRPENVILVVTHREFMRAFIEEGYGWRLTECGVLERHLQRYHGNLEVVSPSMNSRWLGDVWAGGPLRIAQSLRPRVNFMIEPIFDEKMRQVENQARIRAARGRTWNGKIQNNFLQMNSTNSTDFED